MTRLTKWFPAEVKPVHVGVYEVNDGYIVEAPTYAYWDGRKFGYRTIEWSGGDGGAVHRAYRQRDANTGLWPFPRWRGLAEKPE